MVKTTKCRSMCTPLYTRSGHPDTPRGPAASCSWDLVLIWVQRGFLAVFSTTLFLTVLQEIMTETLFWDGLSNEACGRSRKRS